METSSSSICPECGADMTVCPVCGSKLAEESWEYGVVARCPGNHFTRTKNYMDGKVSLDRSHKDAA